MNAPEVRKVIIVECEGKLQRDRTSYGYQWSVEQLSTNAFSINEHLKHCENQLVKVIIEVTPK